MNCTEIVAERSYREPRAVSIRDDRDAPLVEALRRDEPTAVERLIATYGRRAYRLAFGITGTTADAEEVVQDAFWMVVRKIDTFRGDSLFASWLYRIVVNGAYQKLRGRRRTLAEVSLDEVSALLDEHGEHVDDWPTRVEDPAIQTDLRLVLTAAISELPADYRAVFFLRDVEGLANDEISATLGISVASAKTRAHRARLLLRKRLATFMSPVATAECEPVSA
jgi:RNA polymerase sigma-70 factor (ECF subfamily)